MEAARACLVTWQGWDARPKVHFSSSRIDWGFRYGISVATIFALLNNLDHMGVVVALAPEPGPSAVSGAPWSAWSLRHKAECLAR